MIGYARAKGRSYVVLVLIGHLGGAFNDEVGGSVFQPTFGAINDMGFSDEEHGTIKNRPPHPDKVPYDNWCREKLLRVKSDDNIRAIGRAEICESHVYDSYARGDIDFTGIEVALSLRSDAYDAYIKHIGKVKEPELIDNTSWRGEIVFRFPSPQFAFPMPRGSDHPWTNKTVGKLKPIKRFDYAQMEVQLLRDMQGRRAVVDIITTSQSSLEPALCLGETTKSASRWWTRFRKT